MLPGKLRAPGIRPSLLVLLSLLVVTDAEGQASGNRYINPAELVKPTGYTHVVIAADRRRTVYIAGQVAFDSTGKVVGVKTTTLVTDVKNVAALREIRTRYLDPQNPPANTLIVATLVRTETAAPELGGANPTITVFALRSLDISQFDEVGGTFSGMNRSLSAESIRTGCCIAGGGPAGMMLGFLLARAGVDVVVLEKHADFLRDFRGDTIHPSTLEVMHELGLLEEFLRRRHQEMPQLAVQIGETRLTVADFSHLPTKCKFIAFMPQWDFLNFLAEQGRRYPIFHLRTEAEVTDLILEGGRVTGVEARTPQGTLRVEASLVVGADGRSSKVRELAGLESIDLGAPMDALWMQISKAPGEPSQGFGRIAAGQILVLIDRGNYWQCAYVIPKDGFEQIRRRGLPALREAIATLAPFLRDRVSELTDWSDVKLLTVKVDRLRQWSRPGLLCIGDAAHAMSPIGGVGINLAIQDAVAAANILTLPLRHGAATPEHLRAVQRRRELPTRVTQGIQLFMQNRVIRNVLSSQQQVSLPLALRLLRRWRWLQRIPAYLVGIGVRPEHARVPPVYDS